MASKKLIIYHENLPYIALFDLNKAWLDLKQERISIVEEAHLLRASMWAVSHKITEIEEKISQAIVKLEKKNA